MAKINTKKTSKGKRSNETIKNISKHNDTRAHPAADTPPLPQRPTQEKQKRLSKKIKKELRKPLNMNYLPAAASSISQEQRLKLNMSHDPFTFYGEDELQCEIITKKLPRAVKSKKPPNIMMLQRGAILSTDVVDHAPRCERKVAKSVCGSNKELIYTAQSMEPTELLIPSSSSSSSPLFNTTPLTSSSHVMMMMRTCDDSDSEQECVGVTASNCSRTLDPFEFPRGATRGKSTDHTAGVEALHNYDSDASDVFSFALSTATATTTAATLPSVKKPSASRRLSRTTPTSSSLILDETERLALHHTVCYFKKLDKTVLSFAN